MKILGYILATISFFSFQFVNAQQLIDTLNGNSTSAIINDRGRLFNEVNTANAGYEFPAGSGNHLIYSCGLWFGGTNQNGDLKLATTGYSDYDFYRGPYSSTGSYNDVNYTNKYSSVIWSVKKTDILNHISNYNQAGYVTPSSILSWPGNGDPSIGVATQLAPYVDENNNGIYEPHLGDHPCIKGDEASYQIMHEDLVHEQSGGEKIGAEIHIMVYQFQSSNFIDSTTFIEIKVFNRGQNSFNDFKATVYMDPDIGFPEDDYIGSSPSNNLVYAYNGDDFDEGGAGAVGYGNNPPAVGIMSLNKDFEYSWYYNRTGTNMLSDYWYPMNGKHPDGTLWTHGINGNVTQHIYDGSPNQGTGWTELNIDGNGSSNPTGDRRFVATTIGETFNSGDFLTYNYAVITSRNGDNLQNVDGIISIANSVQSYFDSTYTQCAQNGTLSLNNELELDKIKIYPNPASNKITIAWDEVKVNAIKITSYNGKLIRNIPVNGGNSIQGEKVIDINGLSTGVYFVNIGSVTKKLVVQ